MDKVFSFDEIKSEPIKRYKTGFPYLDQIYGKSVINGIESFGLPKGKISIWAGKGGVGKTRIAIEISLSVNREGHKVCIFQNEVTPSEFAGWIKKPVIYPKKYFVSNAHALENQIKIIKDVQPAVVVVDSINMIDGFSNPYLIRGIMEKYRKAISDVGCHVIFIAHLNKKNDVKGNNDVEYLADIKAKMYPHEKCKKGPALPGFFVLEIDKNRYGKSGGYVAFKHTETGIDYVTSSAEREFCGNRRT